MKFSIFLSLLFLSNLLFAQNDTIVKYYDHNWKEILPHLSKYYGVAFKHTDAWRRVDFVTKTEKLKNDGYYEDADLKIKTGPFKSYYPSGKIEVSGYYKQNKKIGLWRGWYEDGKMRDSCKYNEHGIPVGLQLRFHPDGTIRDSTQLDDSGNGISKGFWSNNNNIVEHIGPIAAGKRSGNWTYYYKTGKKCQEVQFDLDSAINFTCYDEKGNVQTKDCFFERESEYPGGIKAWMKHLQTGLSKYPPKEFFEGKLNGEILIQFIVDEEGNVTNIEVSNSTQPRLNEAAIKIIQTSRKWIPAIQYNRKVKSYKLQPLVFKVVDEE